MGFSEIRRFKDFYLVESRRYSPSVKSLMGSVFVNEDSTLGTDKKGKEESYRSIAYKLSEIFGLYGFGMKLDKNCQLCPETTKLVEQIPHLVSAGFSSLKFGRNFNRI